MSTAELAPDTVASVRPTDVASPARILLVDDDERNLMALSHVLKDVAEVVTTTSGRDALRQLLHGDFAVILLDVFMPGMDGYEVAGLIREREQTARIPIIFLSAVNKETEHLMRGYAMGAVDYVFKPVDPIVLKSKVSVFVDLYDMRQQLAAQNRAERDLREANFKAELQRFQIENELQETRQRQTAILEVMPLALFEAQLGPQGRLVRQFVGGNLSRIIGDDADAVACGEFRWEDRIDTQDLASLRVPQSAAARQTLTHAYRWRGSDGVVRHFIEQCVLSAHSSAARWAGTLIDVTERKQLEAQLLQAGKIDAIGKLTGGIAHDFNNLLAIILGGIDLIDRRVRFSENDKPIIDQIRQAVDKGADLVRRMLAFARKQDLTPVSITPTSICESVAGLVQQTLGGTVTLDWVCADSDRNFFADRSQLELALLNLIINARDAMPDGGMIHVHIEEADVEAVTEAGVAQGDYFLITVADEGTGISPDLIDKIIEPFFTTKEVGKGTGLGLSMVVGFVQQSGGKLLITSEVGCGTKVRIFLPATDQPVASAGSGGTLDQCQRSVETVLLVDDEDAVRKILSEQLRDMGVSVAEASNGEEALAILSTQSHFDLILTDFAMPRINGLQVINRARQLRPEIRVALMTGYLDDKLDSMVGPVTVLHKPVSHGDLQQILR